MFRLFGVVLLCATVNGSLAYGQTVDELTAQARSIQDELAKTREQIEEFAEEYNRAAIKTDKASQDVAELQLRQRKLTADLAARNAELSDYAEDTYVRGGDLSNLDTVIVGAPNTAGVRMSYLRTASGDRKVIIDNLRASREDLERFEVKVRAAEAESRAHAAATKRARLGAEDAANRYESLLSSVQGDLAAAVRTEQLRREAEERSSAAALTAGAAARSAAAAAARAAATPATTQEARPAARNPNEETSAPITTTAVQPAPALRVSSPGGSRPAAQIAVNAAYSVIGVPYVWAGASPSGGFDCSGLTQWVWAQAGRSISHAADWQRDEIQPISESELEPGDLVFYGDPPSHVALYVGAGQIINAPYTGEYVRVRSMYYSSKAMSFGRVN